ncbi:hypothetical protein M3O96_00125 [Aquiflexum sp. TKW24L]|uniref:pYEATS domain-containing protein n=1 Tax=Aquiflexum sp. TKW24L TaxID=2942212 RepID=UPI0020C0E8E2|nr:pYEATS domain-containing protein [Aquiflexum sp. TKW24L]MCL6257475.1 hypothetical protein [Aquiflexum sp. TKW24L]
MNKYKISQNFQFVGDDWWKWSLWIEGKDMDLDEIDSVVYTLHPTFPNPVRRITNRDSKFKLESEGWGIFKIFAKIFLKDKKEISLEHTLFLKYPDGKMNME